MTQVFNGAGVALITPFNNDGSIDFDALENLVNYQIDNCIDYLVALGTTAETATLSKKEQDDVVACIKRVNNGRVPIMLGIGGNNPAAVIENMHSFDLNGIDGILSVTPYYSKPQQSGLVNYFKLISKESPLPIVLYNVPSRTGVNLSAQSTIELANSCANIIAIKEASGDLHQVSEILRDSKDDFAVISGEDGLILPTTAIGGSGVISVVANAFPREISDIVKLTKSMKLDEAKALHLKLLRIIDLAFAEGNPAGIKAILASKKQITNVVRLPIAQASDELMLKIETELAAL